MREKRTERMGKVKLRDLFNRFPQSVLKIASLPQPEQSVRSALLLTKGSELLPEYLYAGSVNDLPEEIPDTSLNFILDGTPCEAWMQRHNIAVLAPSQPMGTVFNTVQQLLDRQQQGFLRISGLFSNTLTHDSLQNLIGQAAEFLKNPLALLQNDGKLLAWQSYFPEQADSTIQWEHIQGELEQAAWTAEHMKTLERSGIFGKRAVPGSGRVYFDEYMGCTAVIAPVTVGGVEVAWLHLSELQKPIEDADIECFGLLAQLLSGEMQKSNLLSGAEKPASCLFLQELLETAYPNETTMRRRLEALHFPVKRFFYLVAMRFSAEHPTAVSFSMLEMQLRPALLHAMWCTHREQFVIFYTTDDGEDLEANNIALLRRTAIVNHMTVGISNAFSALDKAPTAFEQTQTAIRFGRTYPISYNTGRPVCHYFQYSFLEMLETCSREHDLLQYCTPMLLRLLDYDEKNGTDLMNTLYEYLEHSRNINQTAEALYIHKNTLLNRLNRIRTVMNCDMNNNWDRFLLSLSFRVLFYKKIYLPDVPKREWKRWTESGEP